MSKAKVLTRDEIKRVLLIAESTQHGPRDKLALALSIMAGMRIGEICALTVGDVRGLDGKSVEVIDLAKHQTKGHKSRRVFVSRDLKQIITSYLKERPKLSDSAPLIESSRTRAHFSNVSLSLRFKAIYKMAGIKTSSHSGRRTYASRLNELGIGMRTIQQLLGHENIATTAKYCDVRDDQLSNAVNQL